MFNVNTLLNWVVAAISMGLLAVIIVGWLLSYRGQALEAVCGAEWRAYAARVPMFVPRWRMKRVEKRG